MGTRGRIAALAGALGLLAATPAVADAATHPVWDGPRVCLPTTMEPAQTMLLCGRADQLHGARLALTGVDGVRTWAADARTDLDEEYDGPGPFPSLRIAALGGSEPLLPGERLAAQWTALTGAAVLRVEVGDPVRRSRVITVPLRSGDAGASLSLAADGILTVQAGRRTSVERVPPLGPGDPGGPPVRWTARTPRAAVANVLSHLRSYDARASATTCAALESPVRNSYAAWTDVLDGARAASDVCNAQMAWASQELLGTTGTIGTVRRIGATQATVDVRLRQRFADYAGPYHQTAHSRLLVVREHDGRWRLATPDALDVSWKTPPSVSYLRKMRARTRREAAARHAYGVRSHRAVARAVVRVGTRDLACDGPVRRVDDPGNDQTVGDDVTRDPRDHRADLLRVEQGTAAGRLCFLLTYAGAQGDPLSVELDLYRGSHGDIVDVRTGRGRALVSNREGDETPLAGATIDRQGPRLRIVLPVGAGPKPAALTDWTVGATAVHPYADEFSDWAGTRVQPSDGVGP
jgi:hypothetical protein